MKKLLVFLAMATLVLGLVGCTGIGPTPAANIPPVASFSFTVDEYLRVSFDGSGSIDSDGSVVLWEWKYGDGRSSTGVTVPHRYDAWGNYSVTLTVTDDEGARTAVTRIIAVGEAPHLPVPTFVWTQGKAVGEVVSFNGKRSGDPNGEIVSGSWDFGDGATESGQWVEYVDGERFSITRETTHVYTSPNYAILPGQTEPYIVPYLVILTVVDNDGESGQTARNILIHE